MARLIQMLLRLGETFGSTFVFHHPMSVNAAMADPFLSESPNSYEEDRY
jgi:hypothetical protein